MNARTSTSAAPSAPDICVGATGGLSAFALLFPGYAYFYFCFVPFKAGGP